MIRKILCFLGYHKMGEYMDTVLNERGYVARQWYCRYCRTYCDDIISPKVYEAELSVKYFKELDEKLK